MNTNPMDHRDFQEGEPGRDVLISRVVDGEATEPEWQRFCHLAETEPGLWRELAQSQRIQSELSASVRSIIALADHVEAPTREELSVRFNRRLRVASTWGGWAVAAAVALMATGYVPVGSSTRLVGTQPMPTGPLNNGPENTFKQQDAGFTPIAASGADPQDELEDFLARGRENGSVIGELPKQLLGAKRIPNSRDMELTYIYPIIQRVRVNGLYRMSRDEIGRLAPVPAELMHTSGRMY